MNSRGNAFIYILIAVVLFGALTFALSSSQEEASISELGEGRAKVAANAILAYATATQNALVTLDRLGVSADQVNFVLPSGATFNTAPHLAKLFHPEGGGLAYKPLPADALDRSYSDTPPAGFYVGRFNHYEETPTSAQDVIFSAWAITEPVCAELNRQLTGSPTISFDLNRTVMKRGMVDVLYHSSANADATLAACPSCTGRPSLCVRSSGTPHLYAFYSIMVPR